MRRGPTLKERFWSKVSLPDPVTGCMEWQGATHKGYGRFWRLEGSRRAHVVSYEMANGPVPEGMILDHLCRSPGCVRPDHLEAVTQKENTRRGNLNADKMARTHCPQGHPYAGKNLWLRSSGQRRCRACECERSREYQRRRRAANG